MGHDPKVTDEEDDWETADTSTVVPKQQQPAPPKTGGAPKGSGSSLGSLRPGAATFQPTIAQRTSQDVTPTSSAVSKVTESSGGNKPQRTSSGDRGTGNKGGSSGAPKILARPNRLDPTSAALGVGTSGQAEGDDWFRGDKPTSNRQIWESANAAAAGSTTSILSPQPLSSISTPSTFTPTPSASGPSLPGPSIKILQRRPEGGNKPKAGSGGTNTPPKTMEEREEMYRLARERIFGGVSGASGTGGSLVTPDSSVPSGSSSGRKGKNNPGEERMVKSGSGSGKGRKRSPQPPVSQSSSNSGYPDGYGYSNTEIYDPRTYGITPHQVRSTPPPNSSGSGKVPPGIIRQPRGPGDISFIGGSAIGFGAIGDSRSDGYSMGGGMGRDGYLGGIGSPAAMDAWAREDDGSISYGMSNMSLTGNTHNHGGYTGGIQQQQSFGPIVSTGGPFARPPGPPGPFDSYHSGHHHGPPPPSGEYRPGYDAWQGYR